MTEQPRYLEDLPVYGPIVCRAFDSLSQVHTIFANLVRVLGFRQQKPTVLRKKGGGREDVGELIGSPERLSKELTKQAGLVCVKPASEERISPVLGCTFPELVKTMWSWLLTAAAP